jgi:hypothetical protein
VTRNSTTKADAVADALHYVFTSPNEADANGEHANVVDAIAIAGRRIHSGLRLLGDDDRPLVLALYAIADGLKAVAAAIDRYPAPPHPDSPYSAPKGGREG